MRNLGRDVAEMVLDDSVLGRSLDNSVGVLLPGVNDEFRFLNFHPRL